MYNNKKPTLGEGPAVPLNPKDMYAMYQMMMATQQVS
mgnify:CR=1 FL=1